MRAAVRPPGTASGVWRCAPSTRRLPRRCLPVCARMSSSFALCEVIEEEEEVPAGAGASSSANPPASNEPPAPTHLLLKLKRRVRRVRFADGTVDNEDLCRKKSKNCCIFHKQRSFDDASSGDDASKSSGDEMAGGEHAVARKRQKQGEQQPEAS